MKLADFIGGQLRDAIAGALADDKDLLTSIAEAGGQAVTSSTSDDIGTLADVLTALLGPLGVALGIVDPPVALLEAVDKAGGKQGRGFAFGYAAGYAVWQLMQPAVLPLQHAIADLTQTEIFDPQTAAELQAQGIVDDTYGRSEASGGNLSGEHYDKLVDAALLRPEVMQALDLWNRGLVTEAQVEDALTHHKIPTEWHAPLKFLRRQLLSPADLALSNLRGEMSDTDAQTYAAVLGVIPEDFATLVTNTGEPPGPEQLMEALRRGFIDQPRFEHGIRQSRIRDEWIDIETKLKDAPMSTADAVRAVIEHYLTDDEGAAIAAQNGLIAEHWAPLRDSWGRPLSHEQMMSLYHRGLVTLDDVHQAFRESDMKDKYFDWSVQLGETLVPQRQITQMLQHGVVTHDTAHAMLVKLGYDDASAEALIKLGAVEHTAGLHTLSRTDIVTAYAESLMSRADALAHLGDIGYTEQDSTEMLDLADVKAKTQTLKALQRGVEASLRARHLSQADAITQLVNAGMDHSAASQLTDAWLEIRGTAVRSLTEAQILKMAEARLITPENCRDRLIGLGLVAGDADLLLKYNGIGVTAPVVIGTPPVASPPTLPTVSTGSPEMLTPSGTAGA